MAHRKIWDHLNISVTITDRKLKFYTHIDGSSPLSEYENFSARGRARGAAPPSVNLEPPHMSETLRVRKLKFYTHIDMVKYTIGI